MTPKRKIDLKKRGRSEHFEFFNSFDMPYFGITTRVDASRAYRFCKKKSVPFFWYYLHASLLAANAVSEFRFRIESGEVFEYERVGASPTIIRPDKTFAFALIEFSEDFDTFLGNAEAEKKRAIADSGLRLSVTENRPDVIHYSAVPQLEYSAVTHPRDSKFPDSVPKLTFGKLLKNSDEISMPVSVHLHHAVADGYHLSLYLEKFQNLLNG